MRKKRKEINRYRTVALNSLLRTHQVSSVNVSKKDLNASGTVLMPSVVMQNKTNKKVIPFKVIDGKQQIELVEEIDTVPIVGTLVNKNAPSSDNESRRKTGDLFIGTINGFGRSLKWLVDTIFRVFNMIINTVLSLLDSAVWVAVSIVVIVGGNAILFQLGYIQFDIVDWLKSTVFEWTKQTWTNWKTR